MNDKHIENFKSGAKERIENIIHRLNATTSGCWEADYPLNDLDGQEDVCIYNEEDVYICQMSCDGLSFSRKHNIKEDAEFIARAKEDMQFLLELLGYQTNI